VRWCRKAIGASVLDQQKLASCLFRLKIILTPPELKVGFYYAGGCFVKADNRLMNANEVTQASQSLDRYMLEQVEINEYKQLMKAINAQLFSLLDPIVTLYSEYGCASAGR